MEPLKLTALRKRLYEVVDQVIATGVPVEIERNGQRVVLALAQPGASKLRRLEKRNGIVGDADDLVGMTVAAWTQEPNLDSST